MTITDTDNELPGYGKTVSYSSYVTDDDGYPDSDSVYGRVARWWKQWYDHTKEWRQESRESYDFYSLHQWTEEDKLGMADMNRVPIVFDRTAPVINMICGVEINTREEITYYPRQEGAAGTSDLLNGAAMWARGNCDAEDEESDAFKDMLICGMGFVETRMDFDNDPDGEIVEERIDPMEMFWDAGSSKKNLQDAKFIGRIRKWNKDDVLDTWPDADINGDAAPWDTMDDLRRQPHDATLAPFYREDQSRDAPDPDEWAICHIQWKEKEDCVRVTDPGTKETKFLSEEEFDQFAKKYFAAFQRPVQGRKTTRTCVWQAFICGRTVLEVTKGAYDKGFTFNPMTGYRDRNNRTWYGLMRAMKDPQRWSNKLYSQILYIIGSQAKGGIMIEADAVKDIRDLEESWTDPSGITILNSGAISGDKVREKPVGQVAPALESLLQQAIEGVPATTGVNMAAMGESQDDESGYLLYQRRKTAITILAPFFDAKSLMTRQQGRVLLYFIQNYLSDQQLIRIGGPSDVQYVKLTRDKTLGNYDVVVGESPTSPDQKEKDWSALSQILPMVAKMGTPIPPEFINYLPISPKLQQQWMQFIQQKQSAPPNPLEQAKVADTQASAQLKQAQAIQTQTETNDTKADIVDKINRMHAETTETYSRAQLNQAQAQDVADTGKMAKFQTVHNATMDIQNLAHEKADAAAKNAHARQALGLDTLAQHHIVKKDQAQLAQGATQLDQAQQALDQPPQPPQGNNA